MTLTATATCHTCGVIAQGDPEPVDKAAAKHQRDTGHHVSTVMETPR